MTEADGRWIAVRVEAPGGAADLLASFLIEEGAGGILIDEPAPDGTPIAAGCVRIETHVPAAGAARLAEALRGYLDALDATLPGLGAVAIETSEVPPVDWHAAFAHHHRPRAVGARLLVTPPWEAPESTDRMVIVVDPGQAFGTGQHATTRGCLEEIEAAVAAGLRSGLDVGTGSGILAVAMSRLGMHPVVAVDVDPAVLPLARRTCTTNRAEGVTLLGGGAAAVRGAFELVVANLLADAVIADAEALAARVARSGRLVLSGITDEQCGSVGSAYPDWRITNVVAEDEWRTLRLERVF